MVSHHNMVLPQMVSPQNGVTRGGPPTPLSDATGEYVIPVEFVVALFLNADAILNKNFSRSGNLRRIVQGEHLYFRDLVIPIGHLCCTEFTGEYFWKCDFHC